MTPVKRLLCQALMADVARIPISTADSQPAALTLPRRRGQRYSMEEMADLLSGEFAIHDNGHLNHIPSLY